MKIESNFPLFHAPISTDAADAAAYWQDQEWKKWAVDVTAGPARRLAYARTFYARSKTAASAIACVKRNMSRPAPRHAAFRARLAGPHELGCVPTSSLSESRGM